MFRPRGCSLGCLGLLGVCVIVMFLGWFVGVPRTTSYLRDEVSDRFSTAIARNVSAPLTGDAVSVEIPLSTFSGELGEIGEVDSSSDVTGRVDRVEFSGDNGELVMRIWIEGESRSSRWYATVSDDGYLSLESLDDGNWLERKISEVMGEGFEDSVNAWLNESNLYLRDVAVASDAIILTVTRG